MTDPRLLNVIDAAKVLDDPNVTPEQCARVRQLASILAQSLDPGLPVGGDAAQWPDAAVKAAFDLAMTTATYSDSLSWPDTTEGWREYRKRMLADWGDARRTAELFAHGEIKASTLVALDAAERRATGQLAAEPQRESQIQMVACVECDDVDPPLVTAQTAFEMGWPMIPSQEPGHPMF